MTSRCGMPHLHRDGSTREAFAPRLGVAVVVRGATVRSAPLVSAVESEPSVGESGAMVRASNLMPHVAGESLADGCFVCLPGQVARLSVTLSAIVYTRTCGRDARRGGEGCRQGSDA